MAKIISFQEYKIKKDINSRPATLEEKLQFREEFLDDSDIDYEQLMEEFYNEKPENKYEEALERLTEEDYRMLEELENQGWLD